MNDMTQAQKVLNLATEIGTLRASDVEKIGIPRAVISRLKAEGKLLKIARGIYRRPEEISTEFESMIVIAKRVPKSVFCLLSALQFHEVTTLLPRQLWIAMPQGSHKPKIEYPPLRMIQFSGEAYTAGIEEHEHDQTKIRVYSLATTIADCFKHRNKIGLDVAIEALKEVREKDRVSVDEIWNYSKVCRVTNIIRPYLEVLA